MVNKLFDLVKYNCLFHEFYNELEFGNDRRHFHGIKISGILAAYNLKLSEDDFGNKYLLSNRLGDRCRE